ncbi:MAG: tRNA guanosine(34) transglycosylase Tgt [Planctomycetota bacterium]
MTQPFAFRLDKTDGSARLGQIQTTHGAVETPAFMAVGTRGTVKGVTVEQLKATGVPVMLSNAFHLAMRPGGDLIERLGGLHAFTGWDKVILTDSGGYQVFSLEGLRQMDDDGATFRSPLDGAVHRFTPESVVELEAKLGADIVMQFDECAPYPCEKERVARATERSAAWAERSVSHWETVRKPHQVLFPIVQGGVYPDLRAMSIERLAALDAAGYGIGGLSVGEGAGLMMGTLDTLMPLMPSRKPRYLMGVGLPQDIIRAVARGVDMFDCVIPTRNARNAQAFTWNGTLKLRNAAHINDPRPIDETCNCPACRTYSRAAIRHFIMEKQMTGEILLTLHNLTFYQALMRDIRSAIRESRFTDWSVASLKNLEGGQSLE